MEHLAQEVEDHKVVVVLQDQQVEILGHQVLDYLGVLHTQAITLIIVIVVVLAVDLVFSKENVGAVVVLDTTVEVVLVVQNLLTALVEVEVEVQESLMVPGQAQFLKMVHRELQVV